ncbi:hypothetical protein [Cellulomonas sp. SG140]|uniref:hypothetical protein n=1 Tax=Cellulomonas sp. SG140 TaxID=2976536 RepID=UPI0021E99B36|nr:hypothetical protein [Cellulomonas sp. SG140]
MILGTAAAPVSLTALSPLQQGDAISGLVLAVAGVGPAASTGLPLADWPTGVDAGDAWGVTFGADTGWYVLISQDCDAVRAPADEPTVVVAPLTLVELGEWHDLVRNGYSARKWPYPAEKFAGLPEGKGLVVDLAWTTSILKGSLAAPSVHAQRPLTGPNRRAFGEWLAARHGRIPFPDDVVRCVLNPCYEVRNKLAARYVQHGKSAPFEARAVGAVLRWFAQVDGHVVHVFGQTSGPLLIHAGFVDDEGAVKEEFTKATQRLETAINKRIAAVAPQEGFVFRLTLGDLAKVSAESFVKFALLLR